MKEIRDHALYLAYRTVLANNDFSTQREAIQAAIKSQAPQFFLPSKALSLHIGRMKRGLPPQNPSSSTGRKLEELYRRYLNFLVTNPDTNLRHYEICEMLIEQPAPEFYISAETAKRIIRKEGKKHNRRLLGRFSYLLSK